jgi:hypothetical protein
MHERGNVTDRRHSGKRFRVQFPMLRRAWLLTVMTVLAGVRSAGAQGALPVSAVRTGTLGATPLTESSGVAVSRRHAGVLWTHNDSNDGPNLYAITQRGELLATFRVIGARAVDWEDLSLGICPSRWRGRTCLYVADTGDNLERRPRVLLYVVPEPDPAPGDSTTRDTEPALALRIRLEDGAHDIEALAVDTAGNAHLITKGWSGPILRYVVPADAWGRDSVVLQPADTLPIKPRLLLGRLVTGAALSPSGTRAAVRTLTEVYFLKPGPGPWTLDGDPCRLTGLEPQGEAVAFLNEDRLVLTSEKGLSVEGVIHVVQCR